MATTSDTTHNVPAARAEAEAAKRQLMATVHEIQYRLKPSTLANEAWSGVRDTATQRSDQAKEIVREKPQAAGAVAALLVLIFARKPLMSLLGKAFGRKDDDHINTHLAPKADATVDLRAPVVPKESVDSQQGVIA